MKNILKINVFLLSIVFILTTCTLANSGKPHYDFLDIKEIKVYPGNTIEVGEEILFDASYNIKQEDSNKYVFEWEFGDGYTMKSGEPYYYTADHGAACTHFYSKPGTYTITLVVTKIGGNKVTLTKKIKVIGNPWNKKFELLHANFNARIAQYIYPKILDSKLGPCTLNMFLTREGSNSQVLYNGPIQFTGLEYDYKEKNQLKILLQNENLQAGNYKLTTQLIDGGKVIDEINEKFSKNYNGRPKVGIDEHNNIYIGDKPFFPVTPWMLDVQHPPNWKDYINTCYVTGWYKEHNENTWKNYLDLMIENGFHMIGPERYKGKGLNHFVQNSNLNNICSYVRNTNSHPALLMWMWDDEPNMGGRNQKVPPQVLRSWTYATHELDGHHPVTVDYYGYDYMPVYDSSRSDRYNYLYNGEDFGGRKTFPTDVIGFNIYPLEAQDHYSFEGDLTALFAKYAIAIDQMIERNFNLVPVFSCIEVNNIHGDEIPGPTKDQIVMDTWLNIVHGIKGIVWFQYFDWPNEEQYAGMKIFKEQINKYTNIILSPEPDDVTVNDSANNNNTNRVDFMVRKDSKGVLWIFAVRVTEITETSPIDVTFTVSDYSFSNVTEVEENITITPTGNTFQDIFGLNELHIYKLLH